METGSRAGYRRYRNVCGRFFFIIIYGVVLGMTFSELLKRAGLSKRDLAGLLGLDKNTPSNWREEPPLYAVAYLKLLIDYNRVRP